jgi:hypothetical protein
MNAKRVTAGAGTVDKIDIEKEEQLASTSPPLDWSPAAFRSTYGACVATIFTGVTPARLSAGQRPRGPLLGQGPQPRAGLVNVWKRPDRNFLG